MLPNVPLYPVTPALSLVSNPKLAGAIQAAIAGVSSSGKAPPAFSLTLVDASSGGTALPVGGYKPDEEHYIASMAKVGVMYSAFVLRDMVRRWASKNMPASPQALKEMIVASDDEKAGECIHGIGYSYLNGVLEASGLFDSSNKTGFWVAGDYSFSKNWPSVRIPSQNDGAVAEASTGRIAALLMAIILRRVALDTQSCDDMIDLLAKAAAGHEAPSFLFRSELASNHFARNSITHSKIGIGPLKSGPTVFSEASVLQGVGSSTKTYIVVFQNFTPGVYKWSDLFAVIRNTISAYEAP